MKKLLLMLLCLMVLVFSFSCKEEEEKSKVDETTDELIVYVWASSKTTFFTATEIETIKKNYQSLYPSVTTTFRVIQNVTKTEFGEEVNKAGDADVILAGANMDTTDGCNIKLKTSDQTKKALIDESWTEMDERYVGIAQICESVHLQNAINFKKMIVSPIPEVYKKQRVLFVGNSYTYYNHLSLMFEQICKNAGMNISVDSISASGRNLEYMLNDTTSEHQELINKLANYNYTYVFLQEQSVRPLTSYEFFDSSVGELCDLIHSYNQSTKVVLYETWAREEGNSFYTENPSYTYKSMSKELAEAYKSVGEKYGLQVSYAGVGFYVSHEANNGIRLYQSDLTHPSPAGTYLAALIHAGTIFGLNLKQITYVPSFNITQGGSYKVMPTEAECIVLREIADSIVNNLDLSFE